MRRLARVCLLLNFACILCAQSSNLNSDDNTNGIKFYVYNRQIADRAYPIKPAVESIIRSFYQAWKPTVLSIHRLGGSLHSTENEAVVKAQLRQFDCNVIVVDWGEVSNSSANDLLATTSFVAKSITELLLLLLTHFAVELERIHVVGFSEGAHIAGMVGRQVWTRTGIKFQRITALDPSVDIFATTSEGEAKRLSAEDAFFVEVLHTNAGALGLLTASGHVDYYLNGGAVQPGCAEAAAGFANLCSHQRAYELVREMWSEQNEFLAQKCFAVTHMTRENCVWVNVRMGVSDDEADDEQVLGLYYVETNGEFPYSKGSFVHSFM